MREDLIKALESHDWAYEYADDYKKYQRGSNQRKAIYAMIKEAHGRRGEIGFCAFCRTTGSTSDKEDVKRIKKLAGI